MKNFSIMKPSFTEGDILRMDMRIRAAMVGWSIAVTHKNSPVDIPGTWNAVIYPYKYFEVYKKPGDINPGEDENEIQCYLSCGWRGMDDEVVIVLTILGYDVLGGGKVGAEIYKFGGDKMQVYRNGKLITDFTKPYWWNKWFGKPKQTHKHWVSSV